MILQEHAFNLDEYLFIFIYIARFLALSKVSNYLCKMLKKNLILGTYLREFFLCNWYDKIQNQNFNLKLNLY